MKEWALKHPILTFFLADAAICGVVNIITSITGCCRKTVTVSAETTVTTAGGEDDDEPEEETEETKEDNGSEET